LPQFPSIPGLNGHVDLFRAKVLPVSSPNPLVGPIGQDYSVFNLQIRMPPFIGEIFVDSICKSFSVRSIPNIGADAIATPAH
jgi:hypothetical protein